MYISVSKGTTPTIGSLSSLKGGDIMGIRENITTPSMTASEIITGISEMKPKNCYVISFITITQKKLHRKSRIPARGFLI